MILGILQARVSSTRLPAKVLRPILNRPMIALQIERLKRIRQIDRLVLATSSDPVDERLAEISTQEGIDCYKGSLDDVLDRFYQAALPYKPDYVVRLTGDCPLVDPGVIDDLIRFFLEGGYDYCSNCLEPTFPDGLDAEVFRFDCLERAWHEALLPSQREHVTPFIHQNPDRFSLGCMKHGRDLSGLRWTVDEPDDFDLVTRIYEALYPDNPDFTMHDILRLLDEHPALQQINSAITRNEGYGLSLRRDSAVQN